MRVYLDACVQPGGAAAHQEGEEERGVVVIRATMTTVKLCFSEQGNTGIIPSNLYKTTSTMTPTELTLPTTVVLSAKAASLLLLRVVDKPVKVKFLF